MILEEAKLDRLPRKTLLLQVMVLVLGFVYFIALSIFRSTKIFLSLSSLTPLPPSGGGIGGGKYQSGGPPFPPTPPMIYST